MTPYPTPPSTDRLPSGDHPLTPAGSPPANRVAVQPLRHPGRWVTTAIVALLAAAFLQNLVTNDRFEWQVVGTYFFSVPVLNGLFLTVELTAIAMFGGIVIGILVAVMRLSSNPVMATASWIYVWIMRGTPLLVQLVFWFNLSALYPHLAIGIPFGPTLLTGNANKIITPFVAALLGLGLNQGAYMAEIVRSGILSVGVGQSRAAEALGLTRRQTMRHVILPQAMRVIIPPTMNNTIDMLKYTSLVSVIGYVELFNSVQIIYSRTFQTIPLLIVASLWYLILVTVLSFFQHLIERRASRGYAS